MAESRAREIVLDALDACSIATPDRDSQGVNGEISFSSRFDEIGFDSLAFMEFCIAVNVETGIEITIEELIDLGTPDAVVAYLKEKL